MHKACNIAAIPYSLSLLKTYNLQPTTYNIQDTTMTKNWLITGGCGFIGTALISSILQENPGARIRVLDNLSGGSREDLARICEFDEITQDKLAPDFGASLESSGVELLQGDIRDATLTRDAARGMDCIVHLAANTGVGPSVEDPVKDMQSNVQGTLNMLEAARKHSVDAFIFASSSAPVGETEPPVHEEIAPHPVSPYGASKLAGEGYCSAYYRTFGVNTVALRFGNVYGPGSTHKSSVVAKFIKQALQGETCVIYGDGTQTRDFIYIDDLVRAIIKAATYQPPQNKFEIRNSKFENFGETQKPTITDYRATSTDKWHEEPWGEIFQIATNKEHTVNEMAEMLSSQLQRHGINMNLEHGDPMVGDILRNYSDTSKAYRILGWEFEMELPDGLARTVDWFLAQSPDKLQNKR